MDNGALDKEQFGEPFLRLLNMKVSSRVTGNGSNILIYSLWFLLSECATKIEKISASDDNLIRFFDSIFVISHDPIYDR
jgi:hypothetical protein